MAAIAALNFGISPAIYAVAVLFGSKSREVIGEGDELREARYDIRMTAFYRRGGRGGVLIRARADVDGTDPFLHLAVVEHGSTGDTCVFRWIARWAEIPPQEFPQDIEPHTWDEDDVGIVVGFLVSQVATYLVSTGLTPTKAG